jgi:hypothetical protein
VTLDQKRPPARFHEPDIGKAPLREWFLDLRRDDRKTVGDDIRTAKFG